MKKYLLKFNNSLLAGINLLKKHPEILVISTFIIFISYVASFFIRFLPLSIRYIIQYNLFFFHLTFSLSIPMLLSDPDTDIKKRLHNIASEFKRNLPRLFIFSIIVFIGTRFVEKDDYIESYNHSRSSFVYLFLDSYYQFVIIAASVYFSIRRSTLAQSVIDSLAFSLSNIWFTLIACIKLMPFIFIQPQYLTTPKELFATVLEQIGIIIVSAWLIQFMKSINTNLHEIEVAHGPIHETGVEYAGNIRRICAALIDISAYTIIFSILIPLSSLPLSLNANISISFNVLYYTISAAVYIIIGLFFWKGQTIGKQLMGIEVVNLDGSALSKATILQRSAIFFIELWAGITIFYLNYYSHYLALEYLFCLFLFSGSFWSLFTKHKQALHDRLSQTIVLQKNKVHIWWSLLFLVPIAGLMIFTVLAVYFTILEKWPML